MKYISLQCRLSETSASCSFEVEKAYPVQKPGDEMLGKAITRETKSTIANEDFKKKKMEDEEYLIGRKKCVNA